MCSPAPKWVYIFNRRRAKKEIPVQGTPKGILGADGPLGEYIVFGGTQMGVYFQSPEGQKGNSG